MILLVNQHTVPIFVDVANAFAASGNRVTLFTGHVEQGGQPLHPDVRLVWSKTYRRTSSFSRITSWWLFSTHYFFYLIFCRRPSRVLVVTNPPFAPLITAIVSSLRGFPYFILLYDLYPEALVQAGFVTSRHWIYRWWQRINPRVFNAAAKIFTLSDSMKEAVLTYVKDPTAVRVIHNWVDTDYIVPIDKNSNSWVNEFSLQGKTVLLYAGNLGLTHDLESILEAADALRDVKDLIFIIIGEGGKKEKLLRMKQDRQLLNVLFLPYQDAHRFPLAMAAADVGIVTLGRGAEGISVPSKTYIAMAAGLCLVAIAPRDSELTRLVEQHAIGIAIEPGDWQGLTAALRKLLADPETLTKYKLAARAWSFQFSPANAFLYVKEMENVDQ